MRQRLAAGAAPLAGAAQLAWCLVVGSRGELLRDGRCTDAPRAKTFPYR